MQITETNNYKIFIFRHIRLIYQRLFDAVFAFDVYYCQF